jgi:hypothetical protein
MTSSQSLSIGDRAIVHSLRICAAKSSAVAGSVCESSARGSFLIETRGSAPGTRLAEWPPSVPARPGRRRDGVSIFAAEMRGRTTAEDRLISRFFGTIGIADRDCVLGAILADIGVEVARSDLPRIKIEFWQPYFRATPAVLLEGETSLFFVE